MDELEPTTITETAPLRPLRGLRRAAITGLLSIGLLVVGGVAAVNAADPSASPAPTTETTPDASDGSAGTDTPAEGRTRGNCLKDRAAEDDAEDGATS